MKGSFLVRTRVIALVVVIFCCVLVARLFFVQVMRGEEFASDADRQYVKPSGVFKRGTIFFKEKDGNLVSAAALKEEYIIAINPSLIKDKETVFASLSLIIPIEKNAFFAKASLINDPYEALYKTIDQSKADAIKAQKLEGVIIQKDNIRFYPAKKEAAHVIGIVAKSSNDGDKLLGRYGIEKYYEDVLGRDQQSLYVNFFAEVFANIKNSFWGKGDSPWGDVVLSIDPAVQEFTESKLRGLQEKWQIDSGSIVVIDPNTGKIVSMASWPNFDPGNFSKEKQMSVFVNPVVEGVFEMGSIVKPITLAAGLDVG
ncbi:MAG: penicillin-binding transpeptidase domain-containing protein, partial [Candidatus Paceibacterota bacterium]